MMRRQPRQSIFKPDGSITDLPAKDIENPQLEKQGDLLLWIREKNLLEQWQKEGVADKNK